MACLTRLIVAASGVALTAVIVALIVVTAAPAQPRLDRTGRIYSVAQFVQPGTGPLWTTHRKAVFLIHGILRRVFMQPVADFLLSDSRATGTGMGGLALAASPPNPLVSALLGVAFVRPLLPRSAENPLLGKPATYRVLWTGCPSQGCARSPWQLDSGGE